MANGDPRPVLSLEDAMTESCLVHSDFDLLQRLKCAYRANTQKLAIHFIDGDSHAL